MVVGTTGWYEHLNDMRDVSGRARAAGLLYGTNFSVGVQAMLRVARELALALPQYTFSITETHHADKKDAPSGTALSIRQVLEAANPALEGGDHFKARGRCFGHSCDRGAIGNDRIELRHEAFSRRGFAEGAVRAAEWIAGKTGVWEFSEIASELS